ncbi:hypothetical protein BDF20DRAFT_829094 [Mycotypha africana]|uniref:uncharacterized protein n=1 Tax=Mycotypha africana TaxID=64632 RepID=UPI0023017C0A|nr:uncharacterized protein BDF20DRAFT_829094 [Mycotypha africana]KAI8967766.1 hypothetical protein BDF20DRAFT_829094 [Mycotypha africana]
MSPPSRSQQQQPPPLSLDEHGQPIKVKKKPGRKPNPASPALRKAQNRAAQRAFRERKERHLKDLESTIRQLKEQRSKCLKELVTTKSKMEAYRAENWYLKGVVLTLQFVCLHHHIHIPTHSPYLTEEDLSHMAKTTPHAIEAYVNAYAKNNINLKPTMAAHFANSPLHHPSPSPPSPSPPPPPQTSLFEEENESTDPLNADDKDNPLYDDVDNDDDEDDDMLGGKEWDSIRSKSKPSSSTTDEKNNSSDSLSAIQHIRLQLRLQSALSSFGSKPSLRLQPTLLQLAIPHDPRIDLIPTPHMRDRMIIFRDQMDYDRCFALLLNGALYHGGDPTMSASWELPPEFFSEFWYLAINYDVSRTNKWRKMKGLPEIKVKDTLSAAALWATDDVFAQLTEGMPSLQPLDATHLASGFDFGSPNLPSASLSSIWDTWKQHQQHERSPSLITMMDLMSSLSTGMPSTG